MGSCVTCVSRWTRTISHDVFAQLSNWQARLRRGRELPLPCRQGELEYGATGFIHLCPELAAMSVDDRPADRQPHARSTRLRGVEGVKDPVEMLRIYPWPRIAYGHDGACLILLCADQ